MTVLLITDEKVVIRDGKEIKLTHKNQQGHLQWTKKYTRGGGGRTWECGSPSPIRGGTIRSGRADR